LEEAAVNEDADAGLTPTTLPLCVETKSLLMRGVRALTDKRRVAMKAFDHQNKAAKKKTTAVKRDVVTTTKRDSAFQRSRRSWDLALLALRAPPPLTQRIGKRLFVIFFTHDDDDDDGL